MASFSAGSARSRSGSGGTLPVRINSAVTVSTCFSGPSQRGQIMPQSRVEHTAIGYLSPIDYERRHHALAVDPDAHQSVVVLATVKDKPSGRPQNAAVLDRRCARRPHHRAGRDGRMAPPGPNQRMARHRRATCRQIRSANPTLSPLHETGASPIAEKRAIIRAAPQSALTCYGNLVMADRFASEIVAVALILRSQ